MISSIEAHRTHRYIVIYQPLEMICRNRSINIVVIACTCYCMHVAYVIMNNLPDFQQTSILKLNYPYISLNTLYKNEWSSCWLKNFTTGYLKGKRFFKSFKFSRTVHSSPQFWFWVMQGEVSELCFASSQMTAHYGTRKILPYVFYRLQVSRCKENVRYLS